jgi:hypothetical protein
MHSYGSEIDVHTPASLLAENVTYTLLDEPAADEMALLVAPISALAGVEKMPTGGPEYVV